MEIADNQHPIDLSRKCSYYRQSPSYIKQNIPSSRPLPGLIPISSLHSNSVSSKSSYKESNQISASPSPFTSTAKKASTFTPMAQNASPFSSATQFTKKHAPTIHSTSPFAAYAHGPIHDPIGTAKYKDWLTSRKELSRQRSMPHLSSTSKMRKSNSDTYLRCDSNNPNSTNGKVVPNPYFHSAIRPGSETRYSSGRSPIYDSSCLITPLPNAEDCRFIEGDVSSAMYANSRKYMKHGPGASTSTIRSLRKLLDKRMQRDS